MSSQLQVFEPIWNSAYRLKQIRKNVVKKLKRSQKKIKQKNIS